MKIVNFSTLLKGLCQTGIKLPANDGGRLAPPIALAAA
jgi:hypothetical protein